MKSQIESCWDRGDLFVKRAGPGGECQPPWGHHLPFQALLRHLGLPPVPPSSFSCAFPAHLIWFLHYDSPAPGWGLCLRCFNMKHFKVESHELPHMYPSFRCNNCQAFHPIYFIYPFFSFLLKHIKANFHRHVSFISMCLVWILEKRKNRHLNLTSTQVHQ